MFALNMGFSHLLDKAIGPVLSRWVSLKPAHFNASLFIVGNASVPCRWFFSSSWRVYLSTIISIAQDLYFPGTTVWLTWSRAWLTVYVLLFYGIYWLILGAIFASFSAVETVCHLVSGLIANTIYSATVNTFPGLVFLFFALCCFISAVMLL